MAVRLLHRLHVIGAADVRLPLRLINLLTLQGVAIESLTFSRHADCYRVEVASARITAEQRERVLHRTASLVLVETAYWT